ncbi:MAG: hypothetical protein NXI23_26585, partial [Bacteroidetes bacterium]|nr:hypothetical protein [Bacteroidota bacterium]
GKNTFCVRLCTFWHKPAQDAGHRGVFLTPQKFKKYIGKCRSYSLGVTNKEIRTSLNHTLEKRNRVAGSNL